MKDGEGEQTPDLNSSESQQPKIKMKFTLDLEYYELFQAAQNKLWKIFPNLGRPDYSATLMFLLEVSRDAIATLETSNSEPQQIQTQ